MSAAVSIQTAAIAPTIALSFGPTIGYNGDDPSFWPLGSWVSLPVARERARLFHARWLVGNCRARGVRLALIVPDVPFVPLPDCVLHSRTSGELLDEENLSDGRGRLSRRKGESFESYAARERAYDLARLRTLLRWMSPDVETTHPSNLPIEVRRYYLPQFHGKVPPIPDRGVLSPKPWTTHSYARDAEAFVFTFGGEDEARRKLHSFLDSLRAKLGRPAVDLLPLERLRQHLEALVAKWATAPRRPYIKGLTFKRWSKNVRRWPDGRFQTLLHSIGEEWLWGGLQCVRPVKQGPGRNLAEDEVAAAGVEKNVDYAWLARSDFRKLGDDPITAANKSNALPRPVEVLRPRYGFGWPSLSKVKATKKERADESRDPRAFAKLPKKMALRIEALAEMARSKASGELDSFAEKIHDDAVNARAAGTTIDDEWIKDRCAVYHRDARRDVRDKTLPLLEGDSGGIDEECELDELREWLAAGGAEHDGDELAPMASPLVESNGGTAVDENAATPLNVVRPYRDGRDVWRAVAERMFNTDFSRREWTERYRRDWCVGAPGARRLSDWTGFVRAVSTIDVLSSGVGSWDPSQQRKNYSPREIAVMGMAYGLTIDMRGGMEDILIAATERVSEALKTLKTLGVLPNQQTSALPILGRQVESHRRLRPSKAKSSAK